METLRKPGELVRSRLDEFESLLVKDGYTSDAAKHFSSMIREQVQLCAKFLHRIDKDQKRINPEIRARREDVVFVYTSTITALGILTSKSRRQNQPR